MSNRAILQNQPLVSVIIVNWDGLRWLKLCMPSLYACTYKNIEVIVVDNGSSDGSVQYLKSTYPDTIIIENKKNLGFAGPNNQGIAAATGELVLFLNNDMRYDPGFIEPLVAECQKPHVGGAQPKMVLLDDEKRLDSVGSYLTWYGVLLHFGYGKDAKLPQYNKARQIFNAKGAAFMVRKDVLDKVGGFDDDYFAYFEETDLCWRIWLAGYKIQYVPQSLVWHGNGQTAKRINQYAHYNSFKNRITTLLKNVGTAGLLWMLPVHLLLVAVVSFAYLLTGQPTLFIATWAAVGWNLRNLPEILHKRKFVQKELRTVSDRDIFRVILKPLPFSYFMYLFRANLEKWPEPDWI